MGDESALESEAGRARPSGGERVRRRAYGIWALCTIVGMLALSVLCALAFEVLRQVYGGAQEVAECVAYFLSQGEGYCSMSGPYPPSPTPSPVSTELTSCVLGNSTVIIDAVLVNMTDQEQEVVEGTCSAGVYIVYAGSTMRSLYWIPVPLEPPIFLPPAGQAAVHVEGSKVGLPSPGDRITSRDSCTAVRCDVMLRSLLPRVSTDDERCIATSRDVIFDVVLVNNTDVALELVGGSCTVGVEYQYGRQEWFRSSAGPRYYREARLLLPSPIELPPNSRAPLRVVGEKPEPPLDTASDYEMCVFKGCYYDLREVR